MVLTTVLGLPAPTGVVLLITGVKFRVSDPVHGFSCLFTGAIPILFSNGRNTAQLGASNFTATPVAGDTCPSGLALTKGSALLNVAPITIGP